MSPEETQAPESTEPHTEDEPQEAIGEEVEPATENDHDQLIYQQVFNIYHGEARTIDATSATFTVGENVRRETGRVAESEIAALSVRFFRPSAFAEALRRLEREHLLILVGPEGSGRAAAALMLAVDLREQASVAPTISRIPPTRSLDLLCQQSYGERQAYVIKDWLHGSAGRGTLAQYDADSLAQHLYDAKAYLVITGQRRSRTDEGTARYEMEWEPPDPVDVFDHCVERLGPDAAQFTGDLPQLRERARQAGSPRRVAQLVSRLRIQGAAAALKDDDERDQKEVRDWFDQKPNPNRRSLRAVTLLVLACRAGDETPNQPGVTQRGFEGLYAALEKAEARHRGDNPIEQAPPQDHDEFPQFRQSLLEHSGLTRFTVSPPHAAPVGFEHSPGFTSARLRELFQTEMHRRYGDELWSPLRICLADVAEQKTVSDVHLAVACGVGRMARSESRRVREEYLNQWAAGNNAARQCAVFALWAMAAEDDLAPIALEHVGTWIENRGEQSAMTAAIALGGALGVRYQSEALWILWKLALRGMRISVYARVAIAHLMWTEAKNDEANVARFLAKKVKPLFEPGTSANTRRSVLKLILGILAVPGDGHGAPGFIEALRSGRAADGPLGELLAAVLYSVPHRSEGIAVLHRAFTALAQTPQGTDVVTRLGTEILLRLPSTHRRQVELGVRRFRSAREQRHNQAVLAAFLSAVQS